MCVENLVAPALSFHSLDFHVLSSPDHKPSSFTTNDQVLASSSYLMDVPNYNGIEDAEIGYRLHSMAFDRSVSRILLAQEESFLNACPNPTYARRSGPKESAARVVYALYRWAKGPRQLRPFRIEPILPQLQNVPLVLLQKYFPKRKQQFWLLIILCLLWVSVFLGVLSTSISGCQVPGYKTPVRLSCVSRFW